MKNGETPIPIPTAMSLPSQSHLYPKPNSHHHWIVPWNKFQQQKVLRGRWQRQEERISWWREWKKKWKMKLMRRDGSRRIYRDAERKIILWVRCCVMQCMLHRRRSLGGPAKKREGCTAKWRAKESYWFLHSLLNLASIEDFLGFWPDFHVEINSTSSAQHQYHSPEK